MPLDPDGLWIIDYRTACLILEEGDAIQCGAVENLCNGKFLRITHSEKDKFRSNPDLCKCYIDNGAAITLSNDLLEQSKLIQQNPACSGGYIIDQSVVYIAAAAMLHGMQVITDAIPTAGLSLPRICNNFAIPWGTRAEFFACIQ